MANKRILAIALIICFGISMSISIPIAILSAYFLPFNIISETCKFEYKPYNSSAIEELNLIVDVGNIQIQYITSPVDYYAMIEVNFDMVGYSLFGKNSLYYFSLPDNKSFTKTFIMERKSDTDWFDTSKWIKQDVDIIVTVNANILYNINAIINEEGNVEMNVPGGVKINDLSVNINDGDALLDFSYCTIEGKVTGNVINGDIELKINNVVYTRDNVLNLSSDSGIILFDILQTKKMGLNISGRGITNTGAIKVKYRDDSPDIGATFIFYNFTGKFEGGGVNIVNSWSGFNDPNPLDLPYLGYIFTSKDFPSESNYKISLFFKHPQSNSQYCTINLTSF